ncbi:MAG: hypothetical protein H7330_01605 [Hymenobacteraceae bacterium]|nr:hypothetical protein [Hymenobacteraceae bacterium]
MRQQLGTAQVNGLRRLGASERGAGQNQQHGEQHGQQPAVDLREGKMGANGEFHNGARGASARGS